MQFIKAEISCGPAAKGNNMEGGNRDKEQLLALKGKILFVLLCFGQCQTLVFIDVFTSGTRAGYV
jgi:hypothetical protein